MARDENAFWAEKNNFFQKTTPREFLIISAKVLGGK